MPWMLRALKGSQKETNALLSLPPDADPANQPYSRGRNLETRPRAMINEIKRGQGVKWAEGSAQAGHGYLSNRRILVKTRGCCFPLSLLYDHPQKATRPMLELSLLSSADRGQNLFTEFCSWGSCLLWHTVCHPLFLRLVPTHASVPEIVRPW